MPNPMDMSAYAPGVDDEVTDLVDANESTYQDTYGITKNQFNNGVKPNPNGYLVKDGTTSTIEKWAEKNGYRVNSDTLDYLYNQFFTEKNNEAAWQRTLSADNTKYQRMVEDMKKAGLNPFITGFGSASSLGSSSPGSVGSGSFASRKNARTQNQAQLASSIISAVASISGALLIGLLAA